MQFPSRFCAISIKHEKGRAWQMSGNAKPGSNKFTA
jgi:hypothetical protein